MMGCNVDKTLKALYPGVRKCRAALVLRNQNTKYERMLQRMKVWKVARWLWPP